MVRFKDKVRQFNLLTTDYFIAQGIQGVIFDLDDTLVPEFAGKIEQEVLAQLKTLAEAKVQVAIVTNNSQQEYCQHIIEQLHAAEIDVLIIEDALKPMPLSFRRIQNAFGLTPDQIALVGDGILTDRLGARLAGYHFIRANWFALPFYKTPVLFILREISVIVYDLFRFFILRQSPRFTWLLADKNVTLTPQRRFLFLMNPASGQTDMSQVTDGIQTIFDRTYDAFYIYELRNMRHLERQFGQALKQGRYTHVVAVGGDGTVRQALTLIADHNPAIILGIVPTGTGNLLAKSFDLPLTLAPALQVVREGHTVPISIARVNHTYATLIAGIGVDAEVMDKTSSQRKKTWGPLAYLFAAIEVFIHKKQSMFWIRIDGKPPLLRLADGVLVVQRNQFARAFLPVDIAIQAHTGNCLNVCILKSRHVWEGFQALHNLMRANYDAAPSTLEHYECQHVNITSFPPRKVQVDGDMIAGHHIDAQVLNHHISITLPKPEPVTERQK